MDRRDSRRGFDYWKPTSVEQGEQRIALLDAQHAQAEAAQARLEVAALLVPTDGDRARKLCRAAEPIFWSLGQNRAIPDDYRIDMLEYAADTAVVLGAIAARANAHTDLLLASEHLEIIGKMIKKRYAVKVDLLLHLAGMFDLLGLESEARGRCADAARFFAAQLAGYRDMHGELDALGERVRLAELHLSTVDRLIVLDVQAATPDDLQSALDVLTPHVASVGKMREKREKTKKLYHATLKVHVPAERADHSFEPWASTFVPRLWREFVWL